MRIKYFYQGLWPHQSPAVTFVTFNALGFYRNDVDFELIAAANTKQSAGDILKKQFGIDEPLNVRLLKAGPLNRRHHIVCWLGFRYLLSQDFDVLVTRDLSFLPFAFWLRRLKHCRVVFESHDFFTDLSLFPSDFAARRRKQSRQERQYSPKVDMIICQTEHQNRLYEKHYPGQKVVTAISGVRPHQQHAPKAGYQYMLGYLGTLSSRNYDMELLISAFSKITNSSVRLLLAGYKTADEERDVQDMAERFGVQDRIEILPWMAPVEVDRLKDRIDVGCCPLIRNKRNQVCTPLKALEYFSAGIPVLYTDLQSSDFIVQDGYNGFLIPDRPDAWAKVIDTIYSDFDRYRKLSDNCFQTAEKYSWEQRAKRLLDRFGEDFLLS